MSLLLKSGTVLIHDDDDRIVPKHADVLVEGDRISKIDATISPPPACRVIDCTNKIVSPGFVDTHHHVWQSPFKGLFGDMALLPYLAITHAAGLEFTPQDMFWANLAGSLEAIDAGTTTTLDHAHMNWSKCHSPSAIAGSLSSGIRSIFAYTPVSIVEKAKPEVKFSDDILPDWVMHTFKQLASSKALNDPQTRVQLGFGWDFYFLPREDIETVFNEVRTMQSKVITSHFIRHLLDGDGDSLIAKLKSYGLLDGDMVFSHAGGATAEDIKLIQDAKCFVSATPNTEEAMQVGPTVPFRDDLPGIDQICSLGVDCHSATTSSLVSEMRLALQMARGRDSKRHIKLGKQPSELTHRTLEVFNMGTIQGARALRMAQNIGSIKVGKKADLVVYDALTPGMYCAAQQDPVLAIVLHSSIRDIDTVIVDGHVRKLNRKLLPVKITEWQASRQNFIKTDREVQWMEIMEHVLEMQTRFVDNMSDYNLLELESAIRTNWGVK